MPNFRAGATVFAACLATIGCAAPVSEEPAGDDEFVVLTTFTVLADMASEVAGDRARVESLTKVGAEIHGYEPTPSDIVRALDADLVLDNGLGLEAWFAEFIADVDAPHVTLSDGVTPIAIAGGEADGAPNPHAWMSTSNAELYVAAIRDALTEMDPAGAEDYAANAADYAASIREIGAELDESLATIPASSRVLVTCEGAFSYFARDAGLREVYLWPVNAESEATPQSVAGAIVQVRAAGVPTVFCESTVSAEAMEGVARESGAQLGATLYVDSLSLADGPVPTYLELLRHNVEAIVSGLAGGPGDG